MTVTDFETNREKLGIIFKNKSDKSYFPNLPIIQNTKFLKRIFAKECPVYISS